MALPCPSCQFPLEIPLDRPGQLLCPKCGASLKLKGTKKEPVTSAVSSAPQSVALQAPSSRNRQILWGSGATVALLALLTLMIWMLIGTPPATIDIQLPKSDSTAMPTQLPDKRIEKVQPAVDKGVAFLKASVPQVVALRAGYAGLSGLALLECGVPADDPAVVKLAESIRTAGPNMNMTYDLAASLFFLNRWHDSKPLDEKYRQLARTFALRIIAGQLGNGIWSYGGVVLTPEKEADLLASLKKGTYKPNGPIVTAQSMSNTQFAMLAVWGSARHDVPVREPLLALAAYFHAHQQDDGHWDYPGHGLAATSTCAGLMSLAMEKVLLQDKEVPGAPPRAIPAKKADLDKAFKFVAKTIGRKKSDKGGGSVLHAGYGGKLFDADAIGDLYFLWTLERVGMIYSRARIGDQDWFDWGYPIVMDAQLPNGSWSEQLGGPFADTCFALLFLRRANIAKDLTDKLRLLSWLAPRDQAWPVPGDRAGEEKGSSG